MGRTAKEQGSDYFHNALIPACAGVPNVYNIQVVTENCNLVVPNFGTPQNNGYINRKDFFEINVKLIKGARPR